MPIVGLGDRLAQLPLGRHGGEVEQRPRERGDRESSVANDLSLPRAVKDDSLDGPSISKSRMAGAIELSSGMGLKPRPAGRACGARIVLKRAE